MPSTTSRLGLTQPVGADAPSLLRTAISGNAAILDNAALFSGGSVSIATAQSSASASYTTLATPDQVTGIVLPANGLIAVWYQATWQESVSGAGRAAIFVGANQLKIATPFNVGGPLTQAAATNALGAINHALATGPSGLVSAAQVSGSPGNYSGDVTTGQVVGVTPDGNNTVGVGQELGGSVVVVSSGFSGGSCEIFAGAGTYTISVQFKASSGSVTVSNRKLWVQAIAFS